MDKVAGQRHWRRRAIPVTVVVLVVGGVAGTRAFASGGDGPSNRLGRVVKGSVDQTLTLSGTVRKASQATSSFKVSGTVKTVPVAVGDEVTAGQTLATLDTTALRRAVTAAQATLAQAEATLASDEGSASNVAYDSFTTRSSEVFAINTALVITTGPPRTPAQAAAAVKKAAAAVTAAQHAAQTALAAVTTAQGAQDTACAPVLAGTATTAQVTDCVQAVQATSTAQAAAATAQTALTTAQAALSTALTTQAKILASSGSNGSGSNGSGSNGSASGGSGSSGSRSGLGGNGSSSGSTSPERIASDKAAVTTAESDLATAKANLDAATLTAPITGTVAAIGYTPGSASGSNSITVAGPGAVDVTVDVPLSSLPKVKVGQPATVSSVGSATTVSGTVRSISLLPASSSSTSVAYPVVVRVADPTPAMASGSTATATITLATVTDVLTVPNSALTSLASGTAIATVVKGDVATRALVRTGAVGATSTQVLSGLTEGQQVVIADLSQALPTNTGLGNRFGNRSGLTSSLSGAGGLGGGDFGGGAGPRVFVGGPPNG